MASPLAVMGRHINIASDCLGRRLSVSDTAAHLAPYQPVRSAATATGLLCRAISGIQTPRAVSLRIYIQINYNYIQIYIILFILFLFYFIQHDHLRGIPQLAMKSITKNTNTGYTYMNSLKYTQ